MGDQLPKDLTEGEKRFVKQITNEAYWKKWVKKTNRRDSVQLRLLVIGKYRIYSIKRNKVGKKQIVREGHIFDLKLIFSDDIDKVVMTFTGFKIVAQAPGLGTELPKIIMQRFHEVSFTFSEAASPKVLLEPVMRTLPVVDAVEPGIAGAFLEVYQAQCDYYNLRPSKDICLHIEDLALSGSRAFRVDSCIGIERDTTLRHNTYFTIFTLHEKSRKEAIVAIADILNHNTTLTTIDISDAEAEEGWAALGEALKSNPRNNLLVLNISSNNLGEKGIIPLTAGLTSIKHPMNSLIMSNVELQSKGATLLFRSLAGNMEMSSTLTEIDVSQNALGATGSLAFADWILQLNEWQPGSQDKKYLRKIVCSGVQLEVPPVVDAIKTTLHNTIETLDLSNNRFEEYGGHIVVALISRTFSLTNLNLAGCGLDGKIIKEILGAISNSNMSDVKLDISRNDMSQEVGSLSFGKSIEDCSHIHTLLLSELNLKKEPLIGMIKAIGANKTLRGVDLSGNFKHNGKSDMFMENIADTVLSHPTLTYLSVAGKKDNFCGKDIIPLFKAAIGEGSKLIELDVRDNRFGNDGARALFDTLRHNSYLKTIHFDGNSVGLSGFQALRRCMNVNKSLTNIAYPKEDVSQFISNSRERDRANIQERLREVFSEVTVISSNNSTITDVPSRPLTSQLSNRSFMNNLANPTGAADSPPTSETSDTSSPPSSPAPHTAAAYLQQSGASLPTPSPVTPATPVDVAYSPPVPVAIPIASSFAISNPSVSSLRVTSLTSPLYAEGVDYSDEGLLLRSDFNPPSSSDPTAAVAIPPPPPPPLTPTPPLDSPPSPPSSFSLSTTGTPPNDSLAQHYEDTSSLARAAEGLEYQQPHYTHEGNDGDEDYYEEEQLA